MGVIGRRIRLCLHVWLCACVCCVHECLYESDRGANLRLDGLWRRFLRFWLLRRLRGRRSLTRVLRSLLQVRRLLWLLMLVMRRGVLVEVLLL